MPEFLDYEGLQEYDEQIKAYIDSKLSGPANLIPNIPVTVNGTVKKGASNQILCNVTGSGTLYVALALVKTSNNTITITVDGTTISLKGVRGLTKSNFSNAAGYVAKECIYDINTKHYDAYDDNGYSSQGGKAAPKNYSMLVEGVEFEFSGESNYFIMDGSKIQRMAPLEKYENIVENKVLVSNGGIRFEQSLVIKISSSSEGAADSMYSVTYVLD